jgi:non-heme chloroperoxidase
MSYVTTKEGCKLYVKDWGKGRPVVMAHGWPLSADSFDDLSMAIADAGMRAISYDRRGFGRSDQPWSGYDYDTLADDLAAVMEQTKVQDATLVGFSMGGGEVARYLSRHGGKQVKQAVLIASVVPYMLKTSDNPDGVDPSVFDEMTHALKGDRAKFWSGFFKDFFGVGLVSSPVSNEVIEWARSMSMQAGLKPTLACAKAFATTDYRLSRRSRVIQSADVDYPRNGGQDGSHRHCGPQGGAWHSSCKVDRVRWRAARLVCES